MNLKILKAQELVDYCRPETELEKALYNALEKELDRMAWLIRELEDDDVDAEAYLMNFG